MTWIVLNRLFIPERMMLYERDALVQRLLRACVFPTNICTRFQLHRYYEWYIMCWWQDINMKRFSLFLVTRMRINSIITLSSIERRYDNFVFFFPFLAWFVLWNSVGCICYILSVQWTNGHPTLRSSFYAHALSGGANSPSLQSISVQGATLDHQNICK